ncbi:MAG: peptidoglycan-binding protein [Oscillospiraceae bacterium]|nr:peptidoglycan-binding protein [Oscillospiraceae bacterium]
MTNIEFAAKAIDIANDYKTVYAQGCWGWPWTAAALDRKVNRDKTPWFTPANIAKVKPLVDKGYFAFDCVNLIKGILWGWTGNANHQYGGAGYGVNGVPDVNANGFITKCLNVTTDFSDIEVGNCVWVSEHVGVYVGDGKVVECTASWSRDVQITALKNKGAIPGLNARLWIKHGRIPYITYGTSPAVTAPAKITAPGAMPVLKKGARGEDVKTLQRALTKAGFILDIDGSFGPLTDRSVRLFQRTKDLAVDGSVGPKTWNALGYYMREVSL